jgi:hypothetical protein
MIYPYEKYRDERPQHVAFRQGAINYERGIRGNLSRLQ